MLYTGWLGSAGKATTFVAPAELSSMVEIKEQLWSMGLPVPIIQRLEANPVEEQAHAGHAVESADPATNEVPCWAHVCCLSTSSY